MHKSVNFRNWSALHLSHILFTHITCWQLLCHITSNWGTYGLGSICSSIWPSIHHTLLVNVITLYKLPCHIVTLHWSSSHQHHGRVRLWPLYNLFELSTSCRSNCLVNATTPKELTLSPYNYIRMFPTSTSQTSRMLTLERPFWTFKLALIPTCIVHKWNQLVETGSGQIIIIAMGDICSGN